MDVLEAYDGVGILAMDDPARQDLLDTIPELKVADDGSGLTIRRVQDINDIFLYLTVESLLV